MYQQSFSVGGQNDIQLHIEHGAGDLHLMGTDETYLRILGEGESDDYQTAYNNGRVTLNLHEDCVFFIPRKMNVAVSGHFGDLRVSELAGKLAIAAGHGDVTINVATGAVQIDAVMGDLRASELGALTVDGRIHGDAIINEAAGVVQLVDVSSDLQVGEVGALVVSGAIAGSAKIGGVRESVTLHEVAGDLLVRGVQNLSAGDVHGDLRAYDIDGNFSVTAVSGDAKIQSVGGNCAIASVGGDARLSEIEGSLSSLTAGGDLHVEGALSGETAHEFSAGGDIVLALPSDAAAQFECNAGGDIINRFNHEQRKAQGVWRGAIGQGGPLVKLHAGGDIKIKPQEGGDVEFRIEINKEEMKHAKEEVKRAKEEMKRIQREIREQVRAHKDDIHRSVHEGMMEGFDEEFEDHFRRHGPRPPRPPRPPRAPRSKEFSFPFGPFVRKMGFGATHQSESAAAAPKRGASDEERMSILKMLEEKRITAEQAELLLATLGDE